MNPPPSLTFPYRKVNYFFGAGGERTRFFFVSPTFLGIVEPGVPVPLAQGSPLRLVPEDGHPARGLGLVELHLGTAGIGLHPADGGRGRRVWGQGTAASETQQLGTEPGDSQQLRASCSTRQG